MEELEAARLRIYALQDGAVRAQALAFSLKLGLFDTLERAPRTVDQIATVCGLSSRVLPTLLAFLSSQDLIRRRRNGAFGNTPAASTFLVSTSPRYVGGRALLFAGFYDAIKHLPEALATGKPWTPDGQHDMFAGFSPDEQAWFADGMFANAVHGGDVLAREVDFSGFRRLLDVGGGSGGYSIALALAYPGLHATIFDLGPLRRLAAKRVRDAGLSTRITFAAGSFFEDVLPRGHEVLLLSSILHDWADGDCATILRNCFGALEPSGTIVVTEPMLAEDFSGPDHPAASGLTMAVLGGENRTRTRVCNLLRAAGFDHCWRSDLLPQNSVITARKP
jgi:2-polyprenyl-3-methyl-5-hydroxy-6-metoxy-1,4-benzoquinol methylase